jgi:hypothetical protein
MKRPKSLSRLQIGKLLFGGVALALLAGLLLYKLGSLVGGLSRTEINSAAAGVGWHGIYHDPLYLPIKLVRSIVFWLAPDHGQLLTRLPNAIFGGLAIIVFAWLIRLWHGYRTALLTTALFATSAWTLHVSRLASYDVLYLWALPTLLIIQILLHRYGDKAVVWYGSLLIWGSMLYIPGLVWLILLQVLSQRVTLLRAWTHFKGAGRRALTVLAIIIWLPLLVVDLLRPGQLVAWAGLPHQFPGIGDWVEQLGRVFVHLFLHGPSSSELWLGQATILDIFSLICCGLGIYFYASHWRASRSVTLGLLFAAGAILISLGGPVSLSLLVGLLYVATAAGLAYILQIWLKVFPLNPLARTLGIGLVSLAVGLGCLYGLRSYFVAWPHNSVTKATFIHHR